MEYNIRNAKSYFAATNCLVALIRIAYYLLITYKLKINDMLKDMPDMLNVA